MRLRLYHHPDGARVAYRETGTGPALVLLHSLGLSHREWEPIVDAARRHRFRVVLPDLPLHGDSEDRPRHPYTPAWLTEVIAGFCAEVGGPHPMIAGHDIGAELALPAVAGGRLTPSRLVLMPTGCIAATSSPASERVWRPACRLGGRARSRPRALPRRRGSSSARRSASGCRRSDNPAARDLDPPRVRRCRRQRQSRPRLGEVRPALASRAAARPARRLPADRDPGPAAVGRPGSARHPPRAPRRRSICSLTRSCARCREPAS